MSSNLIVISRAYAYSVYSNELYNLIYSLIKEKKTDARVDKLITYCVKTNLTLVPQKKNKVCQYNGCVMTSFIKEAKVLPGDYSGTCHSIVQHPPQFYTHTHILFVHL